MADANYEKIKLRAQRKKNYTEVKVLMSHPMETGRRKSDLGEIIPAHFVQLFTATLNGKSVLQAQWGTGIAKDPYLTFRVKGANLGDVIQVTWHDNLGKTATQDVAVTEA